MPADFVVTGIEIVQSVQTTANTVPLIGGKTTYVRVYVRSTQNRHDITGRLIVRSHGTTPRELLPQGASLDHTIAVSPAGSRREVWDSSLNFRLDQDLTTAGTRTFEAQVFAVGSGREHPPHPDHLRTLTATFGPRVDLHVYGLVWAATNHDDSPGYDYTGSAPPWSDFEGHRRVVENILPVSSFSIDPLPGVGPRAPDPQPFGNLAEARTWAQQKLTELPEGSIIYMLQNWDSGGFHGLTTGRQSDGQNERTGGRIGLTMAHELGHVFGLAHTFDPGTSFPRPDGTVDLDDVALVLTDQTPRVLAGNSSAPTLFDIMSYSGPPDWASSWTYRRLLTGITASQLWKLLGGSIVGPPAAVSWGPNRLDLFARGQNRGVFHKWWDGQTWQPSPLEWDSLGGEIEGVPAAVAWGPDRLDVFVRGRDGRVYHKWWGGGGWGPSKTDWDPLGGSIVGWPVAVSWGTNRIDVFGRANDGSVCHKWWDGNSWGPSQSRWDSLGGEIEGLPVAVAWGPDRLDVFVQGRDRSLYHKWWGGGGWGPSKINWDPLGGQLGSDPAVASWGPGRLDIVARFLDGGVYHKWWDGGAWGPSHTAWDSLGGDIIHGSPAAISRGRGRLDIVVRGLDSTFWHKCWDGQQWLPGKPSWLPLLGKSHNRAVLASWGPGRLDVFVRGLDTGMYTKSLNELIWSRPE